MVVVIAHRDRQHLLRFVLLNDEAVEVRLDIARQEIENEIVIVAAARLRLRLPGAFGRVGCSGPVKVANETRSPKFDFMNSVIFVFSSSGEGNGGGGFCSMFRDQTIAPKIYHPRDGCKSDSQGQNSFILPGMQVSKGPLRNGLVCRSRWLLVNLGDMSGARAGEDRFDVRHDFLRTDIVCAGETVGQYFATCIDQDETRNSLSDILGDRFLC